MRFKVKLLIFVVAVVLTFLWFNMIASPSVCLLKIAKEAGYEDIDTYRTRCDIDRDRIQQQDVKDSKFASLDPDMHNSR